MKQLFIILFLLAFTVAVIPAVAQTSDEVIVAGKQSLMRSDIDTLVVFYEWVLDARFTSEQKQKFTEYTAKEFKSDPASGRRTIDQIAENVTKINAATPEFRRKAHEEFLKDFLPMARKGTDANSQMLVAIYEAAHGPENENTQATAIRADQKETPSAINSDIALGKIAQLAGKWAWASSGSTTTTTTGVYLGGNASRHTYQFSAAGNAEYTGIMNVMTGACRMQIFKTMKGKASLVGDTLTVNWQPATFTRDDSCTPAQNYTKSLPAETETWKVQLKNDNGRKQLCMTQKNETCYDVASN